MEKASKFIVGREEIMHTSIIKVFSISHYVFYAVEETWFSCFTPKLIDRRCIEFTEEVRKICYLVKSLLHDPEF